MQIAEMQDKDEPAWDEYVRHSPHAMPQHLSGWRTIMQRTYGYTTHYLMAMDGGQIEGVLPLFEIRSWLVGQSLNSLPGGLCAESPAAATALIERAKELVCERGMARLQLRDSRQCWGHDLMSIHRHASRLFPLRDTVDATWYSIDRKVRYHVRDARKHNLVATVTRSPEKMEPFYRTFSAFTQQMGTPVFSRAFLRNVMEIFPDQFNLVCVYIDAKAIGAFFQLELGQTIFGMWGASLPAYHDLKPTHIAYWELMQFGVENGFRYLDMGRSPLDSGPYHFKKHWGGEELPIYQLSYSTNGTHAGAAEWSERLESDPKLRTFVKVWRRLPLPLTQWIGPQLRRHVPFA